MEKDYPLHLMKNQLKNSNYFLLRIATNKKAENPINRAYVEGSGTAVASKET